MKRALKVLLSTVLLWAAAAMSEQWALEEAALAASVDTVASVPVSTPEVHAQ